MHELKKKTNVRGNEKKKKIHWKPLQQKELKLNSSFIRNDNHKVNENCWNAKGNSNHVRVTSDRQNIFARSYLLCLPLLWIFFLSLFFFHFFLSISLVMITFVSFISYVFFPIADFIVGNPCARYIKPQHIQYALVFVNFPILTLDDELILMTFSTW